MIKAFLPIPIGLEFNQWATRAAEALAQYGVSSPNINQPWQDWAASVLQSPDLASEFPSPIGFADWKDWASRVLATTS